MVLSSFKRAASQVSSSLYEFTGALSGSLVCSFPGLSLPLSGILCLPNPGWEVAYFYLWSGEEASGLGT